MGDIGMSWEEGMDVFRRGVKLLENAIGGETTPENLADHTEGGRLVLVASVCLMRYHPGNYEPLKSQAERLLRESLRVLRAYHKRIGDKTAKEYAGFQKGRIEDLRKYTSKRRGNRERV